MNENELAEMRAILAQACGIEIDKHGLGTWCDNCEEYRLNWLPDIDESQSAMVREALRKAGFSLSLTAEYSGGWIVQLYDDSTFESEAVADTLPLAIAKAAYEYLKAHPNG